MSDNPFKSQPSEPTPQTVPATEIPAPPRSAPGALTPILIICLILGIFGLLGSCGSGVVVVFQSVFADFIADVPGRVEDKEFQRLNFSVQKKMMVPGLVLAAINLVIATMLVIGSIGGLRRKDSGRSLLSTAILAAIVYGILKIVVTIYSYFVTMSGLSEAVANYEGEADPAVLTSLLQFGKLGGIIGTVFAVVFALAILGFYIWARSYLNKSQVVEYFTGANRQK